MVVDVVIDINAEVSSDIPADEVAAADTDPSSVAAIEERVEGAMETI